VPRARGRDSYETKRDFARTPEPRGAKRKRATDAATDAPARFVIQEHSATRLHWDLRLERDGTLASWALPNGLPEEPKVNRIAVRTEDHPLEYLSFEAEIPKGQYGAGTMTIWDSGTYELLKWESRKVEVDLRGERIQGRYALFAIGREDGAPEWMIHRMDPAQDPGRGPMPEQVLPMLAKAGPLPRDGGATEWAYEIKWDGVRALAFSQPGRLRLQARSLADITGAYPELQRLNRALSSHAAILDGEIVAFDADGRPSFGALQRRINISSHAQAKRLARDAPVSYIIFDLLWLDGHSTTGLTYAQRRELLADLRLNGERWQTPDHVIGRGVDVLAATREQGLEGVIAKRVDSRYLPGVRGDTWIKVKNVRREQVVIGGWVPGKGTRTDRVGALLMGQERDGEVVHVGRVGTGFTQAELNRIQALLDPLRRDASPFAPGGPKIPREAIYVEPRLRAEIEYLEWGAEGAMRAPSYKGLVDATDGGGGGALEVVSQTPKAAQLRVGGHEVRLANPTKVLWPQTGFSKRDLVDYLVAIAPVLLPHLAARQLTLKRYPNGVDSEYFFEKNCPRHRPAWVDSSQGFCVVEHVATLAWLGNLADIELHTSLAKVADQRRPTVVAFDLDPGPGTTIVQCAQVATLIEGMLDGLGLECVAKTSGSKGMQVYVPLNTPVTYDETKAFAHAVAQTLEQAEPKLVVSRMTKSLRKGRVFIDWSQNDAHKTTINVYSPRAMASPTVSTPLHWDEVRACASAADPEILSFETGAVLRRVAEHGDLFAPVLSLAQELPQT
jgi:bifunctional non-homologous end joining protein LigD